MGKAYCVLSIQKIKHMHGLQKRYNHNLRQEDNIPNAVMEDGKENEELVDNTGMNYIDLWRRRIQEVEIQTGHSVAIRKNTSVLAYEIVTTFSRDADIDIDEWKEANVRWMKQTFGAENVLSMQLHRDEEGCEHIHSIVVPIDNRGHLCAKSFTGTRGKMFELHNSYGKAMAPFGLSRGELYSKAKKETLRKYYTSVNEAAYAKVPEMLEGEMVQDYIERVNDYLQTKELAHLKEKKDAQRALAMAQTETAQLEIKYKPAISFFDQLMNQFDDDEEMVKKRIAMYSQIEQSVPRKTLASLLQGIINKFPLIGNITKHKKITDIDINER